MSGPNRLPIEDDPELLAEYGRAFAWINLIEELLEQVILFKGKLNLIDRELASKLMKGKMLGQKIELSKSLLKPELITDLVLLSKKRNLLAHSAIGQEVHTSPDNQPIKGGFVVGEGESKQYLNIEFCKEVIELGQKLSSSLQKAFTE